VVGEESVEELVELEMLTMLNSTMVMDSPKAVEAPALPVPPEAPDVPLAAGEAGVLLEADELEVPSLEAELPAWPR
jgi:hypothetical protein